MSKLTSYVGIAGLAAVLNFIPGPAATAEMPTSPLTLAEVDGDAITAEQVDQAIGEPIRKLEELITNLRRQKVQSIIDERLLSKEAERQQISVQALLDAEVTSKVSLVTEQEIEHHFQLNKGQIQSDEETARGEIRARLQNEKLSASRRAFLDSLRSQAKVSINIPAPQVVRIQVSTDGAPTKGPADAPVTIVKFEDYHCPFCKAVQARIEQLRARYPEHLRVVHRDFPIDRLHPAARKAHEAARCAGEQGKFWQYHDLLYVNAPKASSEQLKGYARELGLDEASFDQCFTGGVHQEAVSKDVEDGKRFGVSGTPHFFINGRPLVGAHSVEKFVELIEDELARAKENGQKTAQEPSTEPTSG